MTESLKIEIDKYLSKKNPYYSKFSQELHNYLESLYPTLPNIKSRWVVFKQGLTSELFPICEFPQCNNFCKWNITENRFDIGCNTDHIKRITSLKHFGTEHPNQSKKQQNKVKLSMQEKYGVDYITQTKEHKDSVKKTVQEKYGVSSILKSEKIRELIKNTIQEKYGVDEIMQSKKIRDKAKKTMLKKYGYSSSLSSPKIRDKINKTNLEKYGSIFPMRNEDLQKKRLETMLEIYGGYSHLSDPKNLKKFREKFFIDYYNNKILQNKMVRPLFGIESYNGTVDENSRGILYSWQCNICILEFKDYLAAGHLPSCPHCFPKDYRRSKDEIEIYELLEATKEHSNRSLGKEIDIYLSDFNLGIEYNGIYWHSEQKGKSKYYHFDKTISAENNGIKLLHIFDIEWKNKRDIVLSIINRNLNKFKLLNNNDVDIHQIDKKIFDNFISEYSLFQKDEFTKVAYGCYYNNELVAVFNFSKLSNKDDSIELRKFVEKPNYKIDSSILKMVIDNFFPNSNLYYLADRRFNSYLDNNYFEDAGFSYEGATEPIEYYFYKNMLIPSSTIHQNINQYLREEYINDSLSIKENLEIQGYLSIWDCGKLVYKTKKN